MQAMDITTGLDPLTHALDESDVVNIPNKKCLWSIFLGFPLCGILSIFSQ
jgi:hypothetical protein